MNRIENWEWFDDRRWAHLLAALLSLVLPKKVKKIEFDCCCILGLLYLQFLFPALLSHIIFIYFEEEALKR